MLAAMRTRGLIVLLGVLTLGACGSGGGASATTTADGAGVDAPGQAAPGTTERPADAPASSAQTGVALRRIGTFDQPLLVTAPPRDRARVMVVEQPGVIRVMTSGRAQERPFLDIRSRVLSGGEQGLLGLAFAPDYARSGRFYVYYTDRRGRQVVAEYRRAAGGNVANRGSARTVLRMADPASNHNGGQLAFGPDGLLYIATGDGGGANDQFGRRGNGQNLGSLLGKILRIDPRPSGGRAYRVPADNPFAGRSGARGEIYAYGLRNPWRFSFDRATGDIAIADVGQNAIEEINFARRGEAKGANYGWRPFEGRRENFDEPAPGAVFPVLSKRHEDGWCSITGGHVVRDPALPSLAGRYVYGDFCLGQIRAVRLRGGGATGDRSLGLPRVQNLSSFGEDGRGRIYVTSLGGPVYRLVAR
jgi:glucose/arabinose dehydrogenase